MAIGLRSMGSAGSAVWSCARPWSTRAGNSRSSASTISARSRPTRTCCATTACTAASRGEVTTGENWMDAGRGKIRVTAERDPAKLPWKELGVDVALECTGIFTRREAAAKHLEAGAKKVIVSAPADGADFTVVLGRQPRGAETRAPGHLERLVHDQLPGAGRLCAAPGDRHRARLHDDDPLLYRRPEPAGHAAQRSAAGPRRGAVDDPDLDRRGAGDRPCHAGARRASSTAPRSACRPPTCR